ncbi:hypothetical protein L580_3437 [Serratia fonticola AU-P3(3)]|nr:hypothetical protein L580_3437 [Serratia fonticola AU-P3(3)]
MFSVLTNHGKKDKEGTISNSRAGICTYANVVAKRCLAKNKNAENAIDTVNNNDRENIAMLYQP